MDKDTKRSTVYFDPELHKALRVKSAVTHLKISEIVNDYVRRGLCEDADDLAAFERREHEKDFDFEEILKDLKERGKL